jgi:H+/gluconate symporter-like permease
MIKLTATQQKICWCMMQGYTIKETAVILNRSVNTVKTQRQRIAKKFGETSVTLTDKNLLSKFVKVSPVVVPLTLVVFDTSGKMLLYNNANGSKSSGSHIETCGTCNTQRIE